MFLNKLRKRKGVFDKVRRSIRTRYSLATAFLLLSILGLFYVGGRIVLVHLVKDAETQVRKIGADINRLADRNAAAIKRYVDSLPVERTAEPMNSHLGLYGQVHVALAVRLGADGRFAEGCVVGGNSGVPVTAGDLRGYAQQFEQWAKTFGNKGVLPAGLISVRRKSYYVAMTRCVDGRFLMLGSPFDSSAFTAQMNCGTGTFSSFWAS